MRQIVLDTETTGIDPKQGHRIIEIGCVELIDRRLTGKHYHVYINPEREVDEGAFKVHGLSDEFLADKPKYQQIADEFYQFIKGAELVIHNAPFDVGFIDTEFKRLNDGTGLVKSYCSVLDTLIMAKNKHPGQKNNLDALCRRYDVDNSNRQLHGALLDAEILAFVYLAMTGGQVSLFATESEQAGNNSAGSFRIEKLQEIADLAVLLASDDELAAHRQLVEKISEQAGVNLWQSEH